ncbi:hypothetical protein [Collinsella ihumii]|uniref:hypothetical protein n=1 Tax=Collinsella ihumii TaxID=1720204 RepID=UPI0025AA8E48|nr:hypothetical protein [Collinsella ihumii]MDN0055213.1 hypothetical protein [Collinsella ihumii]
MTEREIPLSYAIVKLFKDGRPRSAEDVVHELGPAYAKHKLLTLKGVDEALATAKENGLLDEACTSISSDGKLQLSYKLNAYGKKMVEKYL